VPANRDDGVPTEAAPVRDPRRVRIDELGRPGALDQVDTLAADDLGQSFLLVRIIGDSSGVGERRGQAAAVHRSSWGNSTSPAGVPVTIVSGRTSPSRRVETRASRRSRPRLTRTASVNSTRVRVASAGRAHVLVGGVDLAQVKGPVAD
jgi:hypothetical protein